MSIQAEAPPETVVETEDAVAPPNVSARPDRRTPVVRTVIAVLVVALIAANVLLAHDLVAQNHKAHIARVNEQIAQQRLAVTQSDLQTTRAHLASELEELQRRTGDRNATNKEIALINSTVKGVKHQLTSTQGTVDQQRKTAFILSSCIQSMLDATNTFSVGDISLNLWPLQDAARKCAAAKP